MTPKRESTADRPKHSENRPGFQARATDGGNMEIPPQVIETFGDALEAEEQNVVDVAWEYVAPHAAAMERVRKATLIMLTAPHDRGNVRGRVHILMHGEGGTGKSIIRNWVGHSFDNAKPVGPKTSEAGLKGSMRGGFYTPGALHQYHRGLLALDEVDEFDAEDRKALLEALAEGEYQIDQAGAEKDFYPAEVRVIAACNRTGKFSDEFMDRWDFVIELEDYDEEETVEVTDTLYDNFADAYGGVETDAETNPVFGLIEWAREHDPEIGESDLVTMKAMTEYLIREHDESGDIRGKEAYLRVAYAIARLNRADLTPRQFLRAIALIHHGEGYADELAEHFDVDYEGEGDG